MDMTQVANIYGNGQVGVVLADNTQVITHVNSQFTMITGYSSEDSVGRNCNFLQGQETSPEAIQTIREGLAEGTQVRVALMNYRKDGTPFWNVLTICPMFGTDGKISQYVGIQVCASYVDRPADLFPWSTRSKRKRKRYPKRDNHFLNSPARLCIDSSPSSSPSSSSSEISTSSTSSQITITQKPKKKRRINYRKKKDLSDRLQTKSDTDSSDTSSSDMEDKEMKNEKSVICNFAAETLLPTKKGKYRLLAFEEPVSGKEISVIAWGRVEKKSDVLMRVHDACFTSEVLHSLRCDCRAQLDAALDLIKEKKCGMIIYLPQEGRGIGLTNKVAAYSMQERGYDTVDANRILGLPDDCRVYGCVRPILDYLQIKSVHLLTNNPRKINRLTKLGVVVSRRVPLILKVEGEANAYLSSKKERMGHLL